MACRFDLLPPASSFAIAEVLAEGAEKYGDDNWKDIQISDHINHLLQHIFAYLGEDTSEDHLTHAACRLLFALELELLDNA